MLLAFNVGLRRKFSIIQATAVATNDKDHEWNMATTNDEGKQLEEEEKEAAMAISQANNLLGRGR